MTILIQMILLIMIFQDLLQVNLSFFGYVDELLVLLTTIYAFILLLDKRKVIKITKYELVALLLFLIYLIFGIISNLINNIIDFKYGMLSMIMTVKGYILYFTFRIIFQYYNIKVKILENISKILEVSIYLIAIIGIVNIPLKFLKNYGMRFGIQTISMGFSHPTELAFFSIISMAIVLLYKNYKDEKKSKIWVILSTAIIILLTGRSKAIAFIVIYIIFYYLMNLAKRFKLRYAIPLIPLMVYISLPRIISELFYGARGYLYVTGYKIAKDLFPFGSGFGTFGSFISSKFYSPLYFEYGISDVWGLSPSMKSYIADTYWAMIMGENGFIGLALIILVLICIFVQFTIGYKDYKGKLIVLGLIGYTLVSSIAEPIYSSNKCAALFIVLAMFMTIRKGYYE